MKPMGNRRRADGNRRQLVLTVPTRGTSATRATADEQINQTSRRTEILAWQNTLEYPHAQLYLPGPRARDLGGSVCDWGGSKIFASR